jgi:hypothetical protein
MLLGALGVGALIFAGSVRLVERQRTAREITGLREELYRARMGADRCRNSLVNSESSLQDLGLTIDSLRGRVESFETMDGGGVPANQYQEYLILFDSYNDSVEVWASRERRLRAVEASCRATIQGHNALSDSLQRVLQEAGIDAG